MSDQIPNAQEQTPSIEQIFAEVQGLPSEKQVPALVVMLQAVIGQMAELDQRLQEYCQKHDDLDKEIHEDFFGPIHDQYKRGMRENGIAGLKEKYGSNFDSIAEPLKAFGVDDVYGFLYDQLEKLKGEGDYTDEMGHEAVMSFHKGALDRIGRIKGPREEPPAAEKPATEVEVSVEKAPAPSVKEKLSAGKKKGSGLLSGY